MSLVIFYLLLDEFLLKPLLLRLIPALKVSTSIVDGCENDFHILKECSAISFIIKHKFQLLLHLVGITLTVDQHVSVSVLQLPVNLALFRKLLSHRIHRSQVYRLGQCHRLSNGGLCKVGDNRKYLYSASSLSSYDSLQ